MLPNVVIFIVHSANEPFSGSSVQSSRITYVFVPPKFITERWLLDGEEGLSKHIQTTMMPLQHVRTLRKYFEEDRKRTVTDTKLKVYRH